MGARVRRPAGRPRRRGWMVVVPLVALAAMAVAGCGGGNTSTAAKRTHRAAAPAGAASGPGAATVMAGRSSLGMILTYGKGRTVYLFENDTGTRPACYGACAAGWPPVLTAGVPAAGHGVQAALLGTTQRTNGTTQLTYAGHPLYYFVGDHKPGDIQGEGAQAFGGGWDLISPAGKKIEKPGS